MAHYYLINHPRKFIAVLSPKCASSTLKIWVNHTQTESVSLGESMISPGAGHQYPDYRKFLFFRDPLRRLVSFYCRWILSDGPKPR